MKKILAVLATLCAIGCSGNVEPRQGGDAAVTQTNLSDMTIYPGSSWTIVDTEDVLGVNLNIKPKR